MGRRPGGHVPSMAETDEDFTALMRKIPEPIFVQMIVSSGLPPLEIRALVNAYRKMRQEEA